jgi:hypothetical protein
MMAKELLFDKFINILSEPKAPTVRKSKAVSKTVKDVKDVKDAKDTKDPKDPKDPKTKKIKTTKMIDCTADTNDICDSETVQLVPLNLDATIKITKKIKTNVIEAIAFIKNDKNKKIWETSNDKCKNKDQEIIRLIKEIVAYNSKNIYFITLNNKGFIEEYNRAYYVYNDLLKNNRLNADENIDNIMNRIMDTMDTGKLNNINNIRKYYELIELNSKFMFV